MSAMSDELLAMKGAAGRRIIWAILCGLIGGLSWVYRAISGTVANAGASLPSSLWADLPSLSVPAGDRAGCRAFFPKLNGSALGTMNRALRDA